MAILSDSVKLPIVGNGVVVTSEETWKHFSSVALVKSVRASVECSSATTMPMALLVYSAF